MSADADNVEKFLDEIDRLEDALTAWREIADRARDELAQGFTLDHAEKAFAILTDTDGIDLTVG